MIINQKLVNILTKRNVNPRLETKQEFAEPFPQYVFTYKGEVIEVFRSVDLTQESYKKVPSSIGGFVQNKTDLYFIPIDEYNYIGGQWQSTIPKGHGYATSD